MERGRRRESMTGREETALNRRRLKWRNWASWKKSTVHGGAILALNGPQLHTASAIIAVNRSQLHMGCSDDSCTLATLTKITGRGCERGKGWRGDRKKRNMDRKRKKWQSRSRVSPIRANTPPSYFPDFTLVFWSLSKL